MKNQNLNPTLSLIGAMALAILLVNVPRAVTGYQPAQNNGGNLGSHHQELTFVLGAGAVQQVPLPQTNRPIFVMLNNSASVEGLMRSGVLAVESGTGRLLPSNGDLYSADDLVMIDPNGPNGEHGLFLYNKTTSLTITFNVSIFH